MSHATHEPSMDVLIHDLDAYIRTSSELLSNGEYVELLELENRVEDICERLRQMPVGSAKDYLKQLDNIKAKLDLLQEAMLDHKAQVGDEIQSLAIQKKASHAYARINTMRTDEV